MYVDLGSFSSVALDVFVHPFLSTSSCPTPDLHLSFRVTVALRFRVTVSKLSHSSAEGLVVVNLGLGLVVVNFSFVVVS